MILGAQGPKHSTRVSATPRPGGHAPAGTPVLVADGEGEQTVALAPLLWKGWLGMLATLCPGCSPKP